MYMFDSQCCSLASITFLVQLTGLLIAVSFRLRPANSKLNLGGLLFGLLLMAGSCIACLFVDQTHAVSQGVAVVVVAVASTISISEPSSTAF